MGSCARPLDDQAYTHHGLWNENTAEKKSHVTVRDDVLNKQVIEF